MMTKTQQTLSLLDAIAEHSGRLMSWLTVLMMVITCCVVLLRYLFSVNYIAMQESVTYLHGMVFLLTMAYALKNEAHVRVDIFYRNYSASTQAWVNGVGSLIFLLPFSLFIVAISWDFAAKSWSILEGSPNADGIPAYFLLKALIPVSGSLLGLQGIAEVLRNLLHLCQNGDMPHG